jgi:hypothetical protein
MTVNDIFPAAGTIDAAKEEPNSESVMKVVLPVLLRSTKKGAQPQRSAQNSEQAYGR